MPLEIIFIVTILGHNTSIGQTKVGTTAAPFLGISVGTRATSMGAAFAAVSDDATSLFYNPGGITHIGKSQFIVSHTM